MRKFFGTSYIVLLLLILTLRFWPVFPPYRFLWLAQLTVTELGFLFAIPILAYIAFHALFNDHGPITPKILAGFGGGAVVALTLLPWFEAISQERNWLWNLTYGLQDESRPAKGKGSPYEGELDQPLFRIRDFFKLPVEPPVETQMYLSPAGSKLPILVYKKLVVEETKPRPWIFSIHGGGWDSGVPADLEQNIPELIHAGYVVFSPAYRLAPNATWPKQLEDVEAAFAWVIENAARFGADPNQAWVLGRSAGGQIALKLGYGQRFRDHIRGVIAYYTPTDLDFGYRWSLNEDVLDSKLLMERFLGKNPDQDAETYHAASPIHDATPESPPTLLIYGRPDPLVWYRHGERLTQRLRAQGARVVHLELPWATHGFDFFPSSPGGQVTRNATLQFLAATRASAQTTAPQPSDPAPAESTAVPASDPAPSPSPGSEPSPSPTANRY